MARRSQETHMVHWIPGLLMVLIAMALWAHGYQVVRTLALSEGVDFAHWYANAHLIRRRVDLSEAYLTGSFDEAERVTGGAFYPQPLQYPPSAFLAVAPLTTLPYKTAYRLWVILCAAAAWTGVWLCARSLAPGSLSSRAVWSSAIGLTALFHPVLQDLLAGQTLCVVLACHAAGLVLASRGHWAAGIAMALGGMLKPQFHVVWLLFLLWRRWSACAAWAVTAMALEAAGWWWAGPKALCNFSSLRVQYLIDGTLYDSAFSGSLTSIVWRLLDLPPSLRAGSLLVGAVGVAAAAYFVWAARVTWRTRRSEAKPWLAAYGLWASGALLAMPLLREHHLVVLLPPLLGIWWTLAARQDAARLVPGFLLAYGLVAAQYATSRFGALHDGWLGLLTAGRLVGVAATVWWCHWCLAARR